MVASWYFIWRCISMRPAGVYKSHDLLTYISRSTDFVLCQIITVMIFVQGRISRPVNGSKLIFHTRLYLYKTNRNIQEPWPPDLYFTVCWLQTLVDFPWLRFLAYLSRRLTRWAYRMGLEPGVRELVSACVRPHFQTWISPRPASRLQSNFIWSIIGVGERLH